MTTTTREAALEAAAKNLVWAAQTSGGTAGRDEGLVAACDRMEAALSTPATEPQGYAEVTEEMVTAGRIAADDKYYKWRGLGTREEGQGLDGMHFIVREAINKALAARPAPQPAAEHEYPDPLIAEDRYEDEQPAADTRMVSAFPPHYDGGPLGDGYLKTITAYFKPDEAEHAMAAEVLRLRAIIGTATPAPAPSDKIAEAARLIIAKWDDDTKTWLVYGPNEFAVMLRALAGKGE